MLQPWGLRIDVLLPRFLFPGCGPFFQETQGMDQLLWICEPFGHGFKLLEAAYPNPRIFHRVPLQEIPYQQVLSFKAIEHH